MQKTIMGVTALGLSLFTLSVAVAAPVQKTPTAADEEQERAKILQEFPQYNYSVATVSPLEVTPVSSSTGVAPAEAQPSAMPQ
ncbi:MAG: hypothetical protein Q4G42_01160 [Neisseria sp.]|nr:hypothetical protein [Neisseria sp.]